MNSFVEKASSIFFKNKNRSYVNHLNQEKWISLCSNFSNQTTEFLKEFDVNKYSNVEIFERVVENFLATGRARIAKEMEQKNYEKFGKPRESFELEIVNPYHFDHRYSSYGNDDRLVKSLVIKNFEATKSDRPDLLHKSSIKGDDFNIEYEFYGGVFQVNSKIYSDGDEISEGIRINYPHDFDVGSFKNKVGLLIKEIMNWKKEEGKDVLYNGIARLRWNMVVSNYFENGTSSITDILESSLYKSHEFAVFPRKSDVISRDVKTFLYPTEVTYSKDYLSHFQKGYQPVPLEEFEKKRGLNFSKN